MIVVDAYSKWPEVFEMGKTDSESTIEKLRECFARFGLPRTIFSDNGRQFTSAEFAKFCKNNGIMHKTSAPYHPSTNGLAENAVGSFKRGITRALKDGRNKTVSLSTLISRYLASYRNVPHSSTGETPAKLMFGRIVRTRLDFLNRSVREKARESQIKYFHGDREVTFSEGDLVYVRDYKIPTRPTWQKARIESKLGDRTYLCRPESNEGLLWKRHTDQIIRVGEFYTTEQRNLKISKEQNYEGSDPEVTLKEKEIRESAPGEASNRSSINCQRERNGTVIPSKVRIESVACEETLRSDKNPTQSVSEVVVKDLDLSKKAGSKMDMSLNVNQRPRRKINSIVRLKQ